MGVLCLVIEFSVGVLFAHAQDTGNKGDNHKEHKDSKEDEPLLVTS